MIFPLSRVQDKPLLDLDHATYAVHKKETEAFCWGGRLLSVKVAFSGRVRYQLEGTSYSLENGEYLILNADKEYDIIKDSHEPVETLAVYFDTKFADDALRSLRCETGKLLDDPYPPATTQVNFFERVYPHDQTLSPRLFALRQALPSRRYSLPWLEEQFQNLFASMLYVHLDVYASLDDLTAVRPSLREELYRRLFRARDFLMASLDQNITIRDMAEVAHMSPSHFLRTFKLLFRTSPYRFLREKRMERAGHLLRCSNFSVTDVCHSVGFQSLSNFSWEFRKRYGVSPIEYRTQKWSFLGSEIPKSVLDSSQRRPKNERS